MAFVSKDPVIFRYTARGGGYVEVPRTVNPYKVLQVRYNASLREIKAAFRKYANRCRRQDRAIASLSYNILQSKVERYRKINDHSFEVIKEDDVIVLAAVGDTDRLLAQLSKRKGLLSSKDEHGHNLLYLTCRSGFYDTSDALLKMGVPVNETQVDGSSPLHAASFYGQRLVVELLLDYGADLTIKNRWGNTAADEAVSEVLKQVIQLHKHDRILETVSALRERGLVSGFRQVRHEGKVVGKEAIRHYNAFDQQTRRVVSSLKNKWMTTWHGTKAKNLESILRYGIKPSGSKLPDGSVIRPPSNHYQPNETHFGVPNWANAIFVSPSIAYASHPCYSENIFSGKKKWCILIKALINPDAFASYQPTIFNYDPIDGEPDTPEYRVGATSKCKIFRVESASNVVVMSVVFISRAFLENTENLTFNDLRSLFCS